MPAATAGVSASAQPWRNGGYRDKRLRGSEGRACAKTFSCDCWRESSRSGWRVLGVNRACGLPAGTFGFEIVDDGQDSLQGRIAQ